jgi:hypothetical protein
MTEAAARQVAFETLTIATGRVRLLAEVTMLIENGTGLDEIRDRVLEDEAVAWNQAFGAAHGPESNHSDEECPACGGSGRVDHVGYTADF